jgi:hypothetical protein
LNNLENDLNNFEKQMNNFLNEEIHKDPEIILKNNKIANYDYDEQTFEDLPLLSKKYDLEISLIEFAAIDLSFCEFFKRNLRNRHILSISLFRVSIVYGNFKRIGILLSTTSIMMICCSVFLTLESELILVKLYNF